MVVRVGNGGGANCTLSYKRDGKIRAFRVRCNMVTHGLKQISAEGHARTMRAYYPHRRSQAQFMLTVQLLGRKQITDKTSEYQRFNTWLKSYMNYLLDSDEFSAIATFPRMDVSIPSRNFFRQGVPIGPVRYGEHVGSALWNQTITFETTFEPLDTKFALSQFNANGTEKDRNARFFYPSSPLLSGSQKPDVYDAVLVTKNDDPANLAPDVPDIQQAVTGFLPAPPAAGHHEEVE